MPPSSRRSFLTVAGVGAAGVGLTSALGITGSPALGVGAPARTPEPTSVPASLSGSLVAYIDDVHGDEVSLLIGDDEIVVKDSALIARIAAAAASQGSAAL
ncbi:MAG: hypothetical protein ABIR83_07615 [Nakamurella sp.]